MLIGIVLRLSPQAQAELSRLESVVMTRRLTGMALFPGTLQAIIALWLKATVAAAVAVSSAPVVAKVLSNLYMPRKRTEGESHHEVPLSFI